MRVLLESNLSTFYYFLWLLLLLFFFISIVWAQGNTLYGWNWFSFNSDTYGYSNSGWFLIELFASQIGVDELINDWVGLLGYNWWTRQKIFHLFACFVHFYVYLTLKKINLIFLIKINENKWKYLENQ